MESPQSSGIQWLLPAIHAILRRSDLATVSAKSVRKELQEQHPEVNVKVHKAEIDALTAAAFSDIQAEADAAKPPPARTKPIKRERSPSPTSSPAFPLASTSKKARAEPETDEELAQRLHAELNGVRTSRAGAAGAVPKKKAKAKATWGSRKKKAAGSDDDEDRPARKPSTSGFNKPWLLSEALSDVVGVNQASRPGVTKELWKYIKANDLQDPSDRRYIVPDERLRKVFNVDKLSCFAMAKHIGRHLFPLDKTEDE